MATTAVTERLGYVEWRNLPETSRPYEVVDGLIQMPPAPSSDHQWTVFRFGRFLATHVEERGLGVVLPAPVDVVVQRDPLRTRQPDLLFLSVERTGVRGRKDLQQMPVIEIPPDLVAEVLSPGDSRSSMGEKIEDYRRLGVRECWLVSPQAETVEVLRLTSAGVERFGLFGSGDSMRSEVLPDFVLTVDQAFA